MAVASIPDPLSAVNKLRSGSNKRNAMLPLLDVLPPNKKLCNSCYQKAIYVPVAEPEYDDTPDPSFFRLAPYSHHQCTFSCKRPKVQLMPLNLRYQLLLGYKYVTKTGARICQEHLTNPPVNWWPLVKKVATKVSDEELPTIANLMCELYATIDHSRHPVLFDVNQPDGDKIDDKTFHKWIGFSKTEFHQILEYAPDCEPANIAVLLCKLRTSLANEQIGSLFGISKSTVHNYISRAVDTLSNYLVPAFLNSHSRETLTTHNTNISRTLFDIPDDGLCLVFDATYRLIQKSANYAAQRQFWSVPKGLPLQKCMVGVCPDGYVSHIFGPWNATWNDATILGECFSRFGNELSQLRPGDVILADRGFRDVRATLENDPHNFRVYLPATCTNKQLSTEDANSTRFVTKCRWIVEQVFGRLKKKFKFYAGHAHNGALKHDYGTLQIAFALLNLFHRPITSDDDDIEVARKMIARRNAPNLLQRLVTTMRLPTQRTIFSKLDVSSGHGIEQLFPQLTIEQLRNIALGTYQLRNCLSYLAEHEGTHGGLFEVTTFDPPSRASIATIPYEQYDIEVREPLLIKAKMQSRFRSAATHYQFVLIDQSLDGIEAVNSFYCTCETGARTVGTCSHIMTVIFYLSYGHNHNVRYPNPEILRLCLSNTRQ